MFCVLLWAIMGMAVIKAQMMRFFFVFLFFLEKLLKKKKNQLQVRPSKSTLWWPFYLPNISQLKHVGSLSH